MKHSYSEHTMLSKLNRENDAQHISSLAGRSREAEGGGYNCKSIIVDDFSPSARRRVSARSSGNEARKDREATDRIRGWLSAYNRALSDRESHYAVRVAAYFLPRAMDDSEVIKPL